MRSFFVSSLPLGVFKTIASFATGILSYRCDVNSYGTILERPTAEVFY